MKDLKNNAESRVILIVALKAGGRQLDRFNAQTLPRGTKKSRLVHQVLNTMDIALHLYFYFIFSFIFDGAID